MTVKRAVKENLCLLHSIGISEKTPLLTAFSSVLSAEHKTAPTIKTLEQKGNSLLFIF